jgi:hypothetical protein
LIETFEWKVANLKLETIVVLLAVAAAIAKNNRNLPQQLNPMKTN